MLFDNQFHAGGVKGFADSVGGLGGALTALDSCGVSDFCGSRGCCGIPGYLIKEESFTVFHL